MKIASNLTKNFQLKKRYGLCCVAVGLSVFGLAGCGDDSASANDAPIGDVTISSESEGGDVPSSSAAVAGNSAESNGGSSPSNGGVKNSSSSKRSETQGSEEQLNEPALVVNGSCSPSLTEIQKGDLATWSFYRETGDVFEAIMAPYVWNFPELNKKLQGNGLNSVDVRFTEAGTYTAELTVDGTTISCGELQVQGIPVVINSCKPDKANANAGDVVTWTVDATSESPIVGYAWSYEGGAITGNETSGSITTASDLHKVNVAPVVTVINADKTAQKFVCESAYVIDPNKVDYTLVANGESLAIPSGENWVVQMPACNGNSCTLICETSGTFNVFINDEPLSPELKYDYLDASILSIANQKVQLRAEANASTVDCKVTSW